MRKFLLFTLTGIGILLSSCDSTSDLGGGFAIVDGGGSKLSLSKDGNILINYTVTGKGRLGRMVIVENRNYGASFCEYYVLNPTTRKLLRVNLETPSPTARKAVDAVQVLNQRSCKVAGHKRRI